MNASRNWCRAIADGEFGTRIPEFDDLSAREVLDACWQVVMDDEGPQHLAPLIGKCDLTVIGIEDDDWQIDAVSTPSGGERIVWRRCGLEGIATANESVFDDPVIRSVAAHAVELFDIRQG